MIRNLNYPFTFAILFYSIFDLIAIQSNLSLVLAQANETFMVNGVNYTVKVNAIKQQARNFTVSYQQSNGDIHNIEYGGVCGADIVNILGESIVNPQGVVTSNYVAEAEIAFDISPNSEFESSPVVRQAFQIVCQNKINVKF